MYSTFCAGIAIEKRRANSREGARLLGPGLNKAGKFPSVLNPNDDVATKVVDVKSTVKFQLKSKKTTCMGVAVANVGMSAEDIEANITLDRKSVV